MHEPHSWDPRQRTTWSGLVTFDFNSVFVVGLKNSLIPEIVFDIIYYLLQVDISVIWFQYILGALKYLFQ